MNRRRIRDPRRQPYRFRLTDRQSGSGTTTWPLLAKDPADPDAKQKINPAIHVSAIVTKKGKKELVTHA